ncbi:sigma-70 family RNA polymerase sigma factor [Planctomycetales bacterium ZRK34]|nr:sigma-70 family RNA polymerase sigma factor [Planctomycetales bacterium ZRK34]
MRLYATHHRELFAYVMALVGDEHQAEEVFQDTSVTLWKQFERFEPGPGSDFVRWAATVALNQVRNYRRVRGRDRHVFSESLVEQLAADRAALFEEDQSRREALATCLSKLRDVDRQLIERCYGEARSFKQIASDLGRPANTVYKALNRIRAALLECVEQTLGLGGDA